jgi:hypothetical protein
MARSAASATHRKPRTRQPAAPVEVTRVPALAMQTARQIARRFGGRLEPQRDGSVIVRNSM